MSNSENPASQKNAEKNAREKGAELELQKNSPEIKGAQPPAFEVPEQVLADQLGLPRDTLVALRQKHLEEDVEFARVGKQVRYTQAGAEKLVALTQLPPDAFQALLRAEDQVKPTTPEKVAMPELGKVCTVLVRRSAFVGHVVEGYLPGTDPAEASSIVCVRVRGRVEFYTRDMELQCVRLRDELFECIQKAPRWKGQF